jgi:dihydropteroate synthase
MQNSKVEGTNFPKNRHIRVGDKLIDLSTPVVMGIVNLTPDSFYVASRTTDNQLLSRVEKMIIDGVTIVDIGGYSSRPGAENIDSAEEIARILPALDELKSHFPELVISLDTFRGDVAQAGIDHGAAIINDISGFSIDPTLLNIVAKHKTPYVLMHMKGTPQTMQQFTSYENIFMEMIVYFSEKIEQLHDAGVIDIIIDPGFGFSKTIEQNYFLLEHLEAFHVLDKPILAGLSRKSMIYKRLNCQPEDQKTLDGTIVLNKIALQKGASILRVHDVKEAVELIS